MPARFFTSRSAAKPRCGRYVMYTGGIRREGELELRFERREILFPESPGSGLLFRQAGLDAAPGHVPYRGVIRTAVRPDKQPFGPGA